MDKDSIYIAALLHDVGKFLERSKDEARQEKAWQDWKDVASPNYAHRRYSASFIQDNLEKGDFLNRNVVRYVLFHHKGNDPQKDDYKVLEQDVGAKLVRIADSLASWERAKDEALEPQDYFCAKLLSPFSRIKVCEGIRSQYLETKPLGLEKSNIFPDEAKKGEPASEANEYPELVKGFLEEFEDVRTETQLLALLEKYVWCVPAQTPFEIQGRKYLYRPDISLFDHLRVTAGIALCLYDELQLGNLTEEAILNYDDNNPPGERQFLLVSGDFSGIQDFIFTIVSQKAARTLKGRSFYLQLLSEAIVNFLLSGLELKQGNLLYNGGGNFYLLAPKCKEAKLGELRGQIVRMLFDAHNGKIHLAMDWAEVGFADFEDFAKKWEEVGEKVGKMKSARYKEMDHTFLRELFEPFEEGGEDKESFGSCFVCHSESDKLEPIEPDEIQKKWCPMCKSFGSLADDLKDARFQKTFQTDRNNGGKLKTYQDVLAVFGYDVKFSNRDEHQDCQQVFVLNSTDFVDYNGFRFGAFNLPSSDFDHLAQLSQGAKKLGILKMDMDNLGRIFQQGIPKGERTISRLATLSRSFVLFFEGYLPALIQRKHGSKIYLTFAGGDDTFLVGAWNTVFDLAGEIYRDFREYTCSNPDITVSASLTMIDPKFPVLRGAKIAEESLKHAKSHAKTYYSEDKKNKVAIFNEVFSWDIGESEFSKIEQIKELLVKLLDEERSEHESRAILQTVLKSTIGLEPIMKQSLKGKVEPERVWRLAYFLRNMKSKEGQESLVKIYEDIVLRNLGIGTLKGLQKDSKSELKVTYDTTERTQIRNPRIIAVAVRWAELLTRKEVGR